MRTVARAFTIHAVAIFVLSANPALAHERTLFPREALRELMTKGSAAATVPASPQASPHDAFAIQRCKGPVKKVIDVAFEGSKFTSFNWSNTTGGGESGRYDKTPVLSATVNLTEDCSCLNAHFSALVASRQATGGDILSAYAMFQVTLTPATGGAPRHMLGHYETPFGQYGPAIAIQPEGDAEMISSNFFQRIGDMPGDVLPGLYRVDVWWSGGPIGGGGAAGAAFVLTLYLQ